MKVLIKTLTGDAITLDVSPSDTIARLRSLIEASNGIHPGRQKLMFDKKELLDDSFTLEKSSIGDQAAIFLFKKPMQITVLLPEDKFISFEVEESTTIGSIKSKLEETQEVPVIYQRLFFNDVELQDSAMVQRLNLKHNLTLYCVPMESITISVVTPDGSVKKHESLPITTSVLQLHHLIYGKRGYAKVPVYSSFKLYYGRAVLSTLKTVFETRLPDMSTLYLINSPGFILRISLDCYLMNVRKRRTDIDVDDQATAEDLKRLITKDPGRFLGLTLPGMDNATISLIGKNGTELKNEDTLKESDISNRYVIRVNVTSGPDK